MSSRQLQSGSVHPAAVMYGSECRQGLMCRREFLTRATALGVAVPVAYGLLGMAAPVARAETPQRGGTLRMELVMKAQRDPRTWDWPELADVCRGWLEYLVQFNRDGSVTPVLLESWEANDQATEYTLHLRPGVKWNNGEAFVAEHVAHNIRRWADSTVEGNSMAARMGALSSDGVLREDAVEIVDDLTLKLHLSVPDIAIIVSMADYPAAVVHPSFTGDDPVANPIGTGPYRPVRYQTGIGAVIERNPDHDWWNEGNGAWLDRIEFVDLGTDPAAWVAAAESGEIELIYSTPNDFLDLFEAIGWRRSEAITASTIAVRFNQTQAPFDNVNMRRALQMAVDNEVVLELGYSNLGSVAENHHVCPIHPEYAEMDPPVFDPTRAREMIAAEGLAAVELQLISVDTPWQAATCDSVAAQLRDAGIPVTRSILPGATFWNDWTGYPFSATEWIMRPLGVQVLNLAYRSGVAWNETGFANEDFDRLLDQANGIADADERRVVMRELQQIMRDEGVLIQPYWRALFRHGLPNIHNADAHPTYEVHYQYFWKS